MARPILTAAAAILKKGELILPPNPFEEILAESDGVMISRADLAMEIPPEKVFIAQKWMVEKANLAAKPVMIV